LTKILVVDDAVSMRLLCIKVLKENKFEVLEAENGLAAVEKYKKEKPDIVFMDIIMPEMDGISAVKKIKEIDDSAVIVMLSAIGQQPIVMEALKAGAKDYIEKPFSAERVLGVIKKLINK
jgi:two-component system, chemotaxis family, chemotaxis protein CheY